jgi:SH3 domain protein
MTAFRAPGPACALLLVCAAAAAQTPEKVYVTRDFKAGLHEEKSVDSAITTLVSSGVALEVVKRENPLSFVRTADGVTGWIDNSYLVAAPPTDDAELKQARERADALERRAAELQKQIADLETRPAGGGGPADSNLYETLRKQNADLEQTLKEERLRAGELQVQVSELRKRIGMNSDNASLYDRIGELETENKQLQVSLAGAAAADGGASNAAGSGVRMGFRSIAAWLALVLVAGFGGGIYLMDYLNRRRHGGFRV